jgi:SAM-dependent methyltransferase
MIRTLQEPLERLQAAHGAGEVLRFVPHAGYAGSFGYEWTRYQRTYSDTTLATTVSRRRLEYVLGFPLRFLEGKTVLEVGAGAGRFTEHLVKHAHQVVAVDLSEAILVNGALGTPNLVALQASLYEMPQLSEPVDVVFCRGVIQHTPDPARTIRTLFDLVRPGGLVIFDVYRRTGTEWRTFKYFWRPVVQRLWDVRAFDRVLQRHGTRLYAMHHRVHRLMNRFRLLCSAKRPCTGT